MRSADAHVFVFFGLLSGTQRLLFLGCRSLGCGLSRRLGARRIIDLVEVLREAAPRYGRQAEHGDGDKDEEKRDFSRLGEFTFQMRADLPGQAQSKKAR